MGDGQEHGVVVLLRVIVAGCAELFLELCGSS